MPQTIDDSTSQPLADTETFASQHNSSAARMADLFVLAAKTDEDSLFDLAIHLARMTAEHIHHDPEASSYTFLFADGSATHLSPEEISIGIWHPVETQASIAPAPLTAQ